jgi:adenylylsulfate kinase
MGLPGSGKTYLAQYTLERLQNAQRSVSWLNADIVREKYNDWDFSVEGRIRQAHRMRELADSMTTDFVICDFVCPLPAMRTAFDADFVVWVDTIAQGRFADTNTMFVPPTQYDLRITQQDAPRYSELVAHSILTKYQYVDPTLSL